MDVALDVSGMLLSGNIDPVVLQAMAGGLGAIFGGLTIFFTIVYIAILVLMIISYWKIFEKAGQPGRGIFIPFYNFYLMLKVAGRPGARLRWLLLPPVFSILMLITIFDRTKRFGKHRAFGIGLLLLPFIFMPILAFNKSIIYTPKQ